MILHNELIKSAYSLPIYLFETRQTFHDTSLLKFGDGDNLGIPTMPIFSMSLNGEFSSLAG